MFTDMYMYVLSAKDTYPVWSFTDNCNETIGYLPCNDGLCYTLDQRCDGVAQCYDYVDEMGCKCTSTDVQYTFTSHSGLYCAG